MRNLLIKQLLLIAIIISLVSCNQLTPETENQNNNSDSIQNLSTDNLTERVELLDYGDELGQFISIQQHCYPGTEIPISAKFMVDLDFVNFGFKFEQVTSERKPDGRQWSDRLTVPGDIPVGEYEIAVTGVPSDGSGALTLYAPIEVKSEPELQLNYDCRLYDEPQTFTVVSEAPLDLVRLTDQDGKMHTLSTKNNLQFSTEVTLKGPDNGKLTLEAYDRYGLRIKDSIFVYDPEEIRICRPYVEFRVDGGKDTLGCISYNTQGKDERYDFVVEIPDHKDFEYRTRLMEHPGAVRDGPYVDSIKVPSSGRGVVMGASPNGEWVIYSYLEHILYSNNDDTGNYFKDDDGYLVRDVMFYNFILLNTKSGDTNLLSTRYVKSLVTGPEDIDVIAQTFKEDGPFYYVLKWTDNDEVYLLEQTKDDKIYKREIMNQYPNMGLNIESPHASARIVRMTLPDMVMHPTEYEPPRAWVGYTDQGTGLTGYTSPSDNYPNPIIMKESPLTRGDYKSSNLSILSTLDGNQVSIINDLDYKSHINSQDNYPHITDTGELMSTYVSSSGMINNNMYAILRLRYFLSDILDLEMLFPSLPLVFMPPIVLDVANKKLVDVIIDDKLLEHSPHLCSRWSNIDNKIYFLVCKLDDNFEAESMKLVYLDEHMVINGVSDVSTNIYNALKDNNCTYIKKGGWYSD
jgi:hypothetical protein